MYLILILVILELVLVFIGILVETIPRETIRRYLEITVKSTVLGCVVVGRFIYGGYNAIVQCHKNENFLFLILRNILNVYFVFKYFVQTLKSVMQTLVGPVMTYILYYADVFTDFYTTYNLFVNCNPNYGTVSLMFLIVSYISTVLYLRYATNETLKSAVSYPLRHSANLLRIVKQNCLAIYKNEALPMESEENKIYCHHITFSEALSESVIQVCMSCLILREFGISTNTFEAFLQLSGLLTSIASTCLAFSKARLS